MTIHLDGRLYAHASAGTNATFAVPSDGHGGILEQLGAARDVVAVDGLTAELDDTTSIVAGSLVITNDGYWGVVTDVSSPDITVAKWIHYASDRPDKVPAVGTGNLRAFPTGCGLIGHRRVMVEELHITLAETATATVHIMDFRMATATPVYKHDSVVGQVGAYPIGALCRGPFMIAVSNYTNLNATVFYNPIS